MKTTILGALCAILLPLNITAQHWHRFLKRPSSVTVEQLVADTTVNPWGAKVDPDLVASMQDYLDIQSASVRATHEKLTRLKKDYALRSVRAGKHLSITERTSVRDGVLVGHGGAIYVVSKFPDFEEATNLRFINTKTKAELTAWLVDVLALPAPDRLYRDILSGVSESTVTFCELYGCEASFYADPGATTCTSNDFTATLNGAESTEGSCECDPSCKVGDTPSCMAVVDLAVVVPVGKWLCDVPIDTWRPAALMGPRYVEIPVVSAQLCDAADRTFSFGFFDNVDCEGEPSCTISLVLGCQNCNLPCTFPF